MNGLKRILPMFFSVAVMFGVLCTPVSALTERDNGYEHYYGDQLNERAKGIYDKLAELRDSDLKAKNEIEFRFPDIEEMSEIDKLNKDFTNALTALRRDYPEIFWLDKSQALNYSYKKGTSSISDVRLLYTPTRTSAYRSTQAVDDMQVQLEAQIDALAEKALQRGGTYEQLLYFHDWLTLNNAYNSDKLAGIDNVTPNAIEAVSALVSGHKGKEGPVCEGYSRAFKLLCDEVGIPCILVSGTSSDSRGTFNHMWNEVMLNGQWYSVDITSDDPLINGEDTQGVSDYFLKGEGAEVYQNHRLNGVLAKGGMRFAYPALAPSDYIS